MKYSPRRIVALLLALIMVLSLSPLDAVAEIFTTYEANIVIDTSDPVQISEAVVTSKVTSPDGVSVVVSSIDDILPAKGWVDFTSETPKAEEQKSEVEPMLASVVVTKEKISLEELCLEVLGKMSETLRSSGQESCVKVEMKPVITSNRQLLEKALTGILLYASEYSRAGETITVTLSRKELVVEKSLLRKEISVGTVGKSYGGTFRPEKDEHLLEAKLALDLAGLELASGAMDGRVKLKVLFETEEFLVR